MNSDDWERYFTVGLGLPSSQVSVLKDSTASRMQIENGVKRAEKKLKRDGKLWVVYIGHGITMFDSGEAATLPYYAPTEPKELYESAISTSEIASLIGKSDAQSIFVFDTSFNGLDRKGNHFRKHCLLNQV